MIAEDTVSKAFGDRTEGIHYEYLNGALQHGSF